MRRADGADSAAGEAAEPGGGAAADGRHPALVALGRQIRKVRRERGISQEDFAARAGLGRSYYGGIERGERNVAALNLMRIAAALGVEAGELFPRLHEVHASLVRGDAAPDAEER